MGFGGKFKKAFKKLKNNPVSKAVSKVVEKVDKVAAPIVEKIPGGEKLAESMKRASGISLITDPYQGVQDLLGMGVLGPGMGSFVGWDNAGDIIGEYGGGALKGLKQMVNPDKPPEAPAPPKPDAPNYTTAWKEFANWNANAAAKRDSSISLARAKLYEAGARPDVIAAHESDLRAQFDKQMQTYQSGATYKMLQEGFDIARGAKENPYANPPVKAAEGQDLSAYYTANYGGGEVDPDPKEALYRARRAAAGGSVRPGSAKAGPAPGGGGGMAMPDYETAPGANPWVA